MIAVDVSKKVADGMPSKNGVSLRSVTAAL